VENVKLEVLLYYARRFFVYSLKSCYSVQAPGVSSRKPYRIDSPRQF